MYLPIYILLLKKSFSNNFSEQLPSIIFVFLNIFVLKYIEVIIFIFKNLFLTLTHENNLKILI